MESEVQETEVEQILRLVAFLCRLSSKTILGSLCIMYNWKHATRLPKLGHRWQAERGATFEIAETPIAASRNAHPPRGRPELGQKKARA